MAEMGLPEKDADPLPGEAKSYAKGEPIPSDMPQANGAKTPGFGDMLGGVDPSITSGLADLKRREIAATGGAAGAMTHALDRDMARIQHAYDAEGASANDPMLKPWNAEQEQAKHHTDPIESFGSFASVMGILASSFTHAPLENALNASAAAINSIKAQDDKAYERAYKAWQDNSKLALDRHKLQHEAYQDAIELMKTNMVAGQAKMRVAAARFGDQKTLFLLEHGLDKEVLDLQAGRQKLALDLAQNMPKLMLENLKMSTLLNDPRYKLPPNDPQRMQMIHEFQQEWSGQRRTLDEQFAEKWVAEHPKATSEEFGAAVSKFKRESSPYSGRLTAAGSEEAFVSAKKAEKEAAGGTWNTDDDLAARQAWKKAHTAGLDLRERALDLKAREVDERERHSRAVEAIQARGGDTREALVKERERHDKEMERIQEKGKGAASDLTKDRQIAQDVKALVEKYKEEHPGATAQEIADYRSHQFSRLGTQAGAMTSNRADDIRGKVSQVELAEGTIGHIENMLKKHNAITGLGGKVTRPAEVVTNVFGGNETDRKQFQRWVSELQEIAPRILLDSKGRPLSSEAGRVENIIAGLQFGDTTANTARAYYEFKKVLQQIKGNLRSRLEGTFDDRFKGEAPGTAAPQPSDNSWYKSAPLVH